MSQNNNNITPAKRKHLNLEERKIIERLLREGKNKSEIARLLSRDKSTIKREIIRGTVLQRKQNNYVSRNPKYPEYIEEKVYFSDVGQRVYEENRQNCGNKSKILKCSNIVAYIEQKILGKEKWSPDAAIGYAKAQGMYETETISTKTFYNWIDSGLVKVKNIDLHLKVRRKLRNPIRERKKNLGKRIDERPQEVDGREVFGHWEGDGIVGKRHKGHIITLVERKTRMGLMFNVKTRESKKAVEILDILEEKYGENFKKMFKSITFDNGAEFSDSKEMEKASRTEIYYANPYSSWERGSNENWNGIVRRFIPKGSSFERITNESLERISHYINTLPRKSLGYKTPLDKWIKELELLAI